MNLELARWSVSELPLFALTAMGTHPRGHLLSSRIAARKEMMRLVRGWLEPTRSIPIECRSHLDEMDVCRVGRSNRSVLSWVSRSPSCIGSR
jgi:hypothetical protein